MEIVAQDIEYTFNPGTPLELRVLKGITFAQPRGTVLGILGGNGSGKTTLIRNLSGLVRPTRGKALLDGKDPASYGAALRRKVGVVFQCPERQLFGETVFEDIAFALRRFSGYSAEKIRSMVEEAAELVALDLRTVAERSPLALSQGEQRKVVIAGVLANRPEVLVLDEPAAGLDLPSTGELIKAIAGLKESGTRTVVVVSHDMNPFLEILDLLLVLEQGRAVAFGSPQDVCSALAPVPHMRELLPGLAVLLYDLRGAGCPIPSGEFRIPALVEQMARGLSARGEVH